MALVFDNAGIGKVQYGELDVSEVYVGENLVWPATSLGQSVAASFEHASYSTAEGYATVIPDVVITPDNFFAVGSASSNSVPNASISAYMGIYARAFGDSEPQGTSTGSVLASSLTGTSNVEVPDWVEGIDIAVVGGGSAGVAHGGALGAPGSGGGAGQWGYGQLVLRTLFADLGLDRENYKVFIKNIVVGAGASVQMTNGSPTRLDVVAVPKAGGADIKLVDTIVGSGGITAWGGADGEITKGESAGNIDLNGYTYSGGAGGAPGGTAATRAGQTPGGGGAGGPTALDPTAGVGAPGRAFWRFYNDATYSLHNFLAPTTPGVWQRMALPVDTVELDFALVGGGGGGSSGGNFNNNGTGGKGGQWRGGSVSAGLLVANLYASPSDGLGAINPANVSQLRFEYQVGAGGAAGVGGTGQAAGAGTASQARITATVSGASRTLLGPISAPGGAGNGNTGKNEGEAANGGDFNGGRDRRMRVLGRDFTCKGGRGGITTSTGFSGNPGQAPGGGGGGGFGAPLFAAGTNGSKGGDGAVFLAYGSLEPVKKVYVFECLGTSDNAKTSFLSRHLDKNMFEHGFVRGYPNSLLPFGVIPGFPSNPGDTNFSVSVNRGVAEVMKLVNGSTGPFVLVGTSQGAQIMSETWRTHIKNNPALTARCKGIFLMGNPLRERGKDFPGCRNPASGHGIATPDLRLQGTISDPYWKNLIWEFANDGGGTGPGDPVCTNTTSATGGNALGDSVQNSFASLWNFFSVIDLLPLLVNFGGVFAMLSGMNAAHNLYGYNADGGPVDMSNPYKPNRGTGDNRPGWKIIVDELNNVIGPTETRRGTWVPSGRLDSSPIDFTQAVTGGGSEMSATAEVVFT